MTTFLAILALSGSSLAADVVAPGSSAELLGEAVHEASMGVQQRCETQRCRPQARPAARPSTTKRSTSHRPSSTARPVTRSRPSTSRPAPRPSTTHRAHVSASVRSSSRPVTTSRSIQRSRASQNTHSSTSLSIEAGFSVRTTQARPHGGIVRPLAIPRSRTYSDRAHNYNRPSPRQSAPQVSVRRPAPRVAHRPHRTYVRPQVVRPQVSHHYHYRPYHGVFVYGPSVRHHSYYRGQPSRVSVQKEHLPSRAVNRQGTWAVGVRSGSYLTAYDGSDVYGDFGLGVTARYRPYEALGIEAAITHHDQTWEEVTERSQTIGQASVMVFANPWGRISPYALGGLTANARQINDRFYVDGGADQVTTSDMLWGPHAGVGIEFAFGKNVALDLEARYTAYLNTEMDDPTLPGAVQTTAGFLVHF